MTYRLQKEIEKLKQQILTLVAEVEDISFGMPVTHVYNPLVYARQTFDIYLERFATTNVEVLLLGMNPGPFGMAQTGIPFGDITMVRDWIGIEGPVNKPHNEHPKRPVTGFACPRSEVSGTRLWGWAQDTFKTPEKFFNQFFVYNYCPLSFMEETGRNRTPDKLPADERNPLFAACDKALRSFVEYLEPEHVLGIGVFAEKQIKSALAGYDVKTGRILHPSPASPAANKGWAKIVTKELEELGIV